MVLCHSDPFWKETGVALVMRSPPPSLVLHPWHLAEERQVRVPRDLAQDHILHALPQTNEVGSQAFWGFPGGSAVKNPPVMEETRVQSLGREDPLEKGMATHSSILAWKIPWTEEPDGLQSTGLQRVRYNLATEHAHYQEVGRLKPNNKIHFKNAIWSLAGLPGWSVIKKLSI